MHGVAGFPASKKVKLDFVGDVDPLNIPHNTKATME